MQKERKVLFLVENMSVPGDPRVWNEARILRDAGYQVCIIAPKGACSWQQESRSWLDGISIYRFPRLEAQARLLSYVLEYGIALCFIFWLSLKIWRRHGFDVVHAANPPDILFLIGLFYRCFGKKFVFDQHDLSPELFQVLASRRVSWLLHLFALLEKCSCRCAHLVITANESCKGLIQKRGSCAARKVCVVRSGVELEPVELVAQPFFPNRRKYVLAYVGVMGQQDGVKYALYALYYLVYIYGQRDVSAVFIGSGSMLGELRALAHRLELDDYVFFTGWLEMRGVRSYLAQADIGLIPDPQNGLNEFCTLLKALEYMAMGLPVVAFDLAETRVSTGDAALYARPNEVADFAWQLALLLDHEDWRWRMGAIGRQRIAELFNWERSSKDLLAAYERLFACEQAGQSGLVSDP